MLSIDAVARVIVTVNSVPESSDIFDVGLILAALPVGTSFSEDLRAVSYETLSQATAHLTQLGYATTDAAYQTVAKYFGASPAPARLIVSYYAASEGIVAAFAAVVASSAAFYGICPAQSEDTADLLALSQAVEAANRPLVLFVPVYGTVLNVVAADSLLSSLHAAGTSRALTFYSGASEDSVSDIGAVLGTAMGLELTHPESAFALCYKQIAGISPVDLTAAELGLLKALYCNAYVTRGYTHKLLEQGTVMDGSRYDERLYVDMISSDLQDAAVSLLVENPDKIPQTDDASAQFINRFSAILLTYTSRGVLATGSWRGNRIGPVEPGDTVENGFTLWADSYDRQSDADRADHKAMPIHVGLLLAGSVESVVIMINVQI